MEQLSNFQVLITFYQVRSYLYPEDLEVMPDKRNWWRSKKLEFGSNPYSAVPTSRNWILNEVNFSLYTDYLQ